MTVEAVCRRPLWLRCSGRAGVRGRRDVRWTESAGVVPPRQSRWIRHRGGLAGAIRRRVSRADEAMGWPRSRRAGRSAPAPGTATPPRRSPDCVESAGRAEQDADQPRRSAGVLRRIGAPAPKGVLRCASSRCFLFDLDGTLVDSVYQHVLAWKEPLDAEGIELSVWRIHRKIGMSGGLFTNQLLRETGLAISPDRLERLRLRHAAAYRRHASDIRPLPGARELLGWLTTEGVPWAIATSGRMETAASTSPRSASIPTATPVVTRDQVKYAKPDPDLFLAAAERLNAPIQTRGASATASGTCWRRRAAAPWRSACSAAVMVLRNCSRPARSGSMRTPPICWRISTRSAGGGEGGASEIGALGKHGDVSPNSLWLKDQSAAPMSLASSNSRCSLPRRYYNSNRPIRRRCLPSMSRPPIPDTIARRTAVNGVAGPESGSNIFPDITWSRSGPIRATTVTPVG